jgi:hypothetical protein
MRENMNKKINIVTVNTNFYETPDLLITKVKQLTEEFKGQPIVIVFPEAVLALSAISRIKGKNIARTLSSIVTKHGEACVSYSVFENRGKNSPLVTNSGYLVFPRTQTEPQGYKVYPKMSTYGNGNALTIGDEIALGRNTKDIQKGKERIFRLAQKIRSFPRTTLNSARIEMRICRDATERRDLDMPPAKRANQETDLIVVPADGLSIKRFELQHLAKKLSDGGIALIFDGIEKTTTIIQKTGNEIKISTLEQKDSKVGQAILNVYDITKARLFRLIRRKQNSNANRIRRIPKHRRLGKFNVIPK